MFRGSPVSLRTKLHSCFVFVTIFLLAMAAPAQQQPGSAAGPGSQQKPMASPQTPAPSPGSQTAPQPPATGEQRSTTSEQPGAQPPANASGQPAKSKQPPSQAQPEVVEEPQQPKTEILDSSATSGGLETSGHDPILDPPPLPIGTTTMVGGVIRHVDRVRNRLVIGIFSGDDWTVNFDERTHIFLNGAETTQLALKKGARVYVDTMLDNNSHDIFARNIRLGVSAPPADADGQIERVDTAHGELTLLDRINSVPVNFGVTEETRIRHGSNPVTLADVKPGTLVHVKFAPEGGYRGVAREITIIAVPGAAFTFVGQITYLDVHRGLLAVANETDGRTYDIHFSPGRVANAANLRVGQQATVVATFEGPQYTAQSVSITGHPK